MRRSGSGWSVLVRGQAHRVLQPGELRHLREGCDLRPWPAGEHDLYVRIVPAHITGRRIKPEQGARSRPMANDGTARWGGGSGDETKTRVERP